MKKIFGIISFSLLMCGIVALAICYIVIPEQTKLAADVVVEYLNKPLGIIGGTTITLGIVFAFVLKTLLGTYQSNIKSELYKVKEFNANAVVNAQNYYDKADKVKEETKAILSAYSKQIDECIEKVVKVCQTIPNAKVNALGQEILNGSVEIKQELTNELTQLDNEFVVVMEQKATMEELQNQIKLLTEKVERLVEDNGNETTNNETKD